MTRQVNLRKSLNMLQSPSRTFETTNTKSPFPKSKRAGLLALALSMGVLAACSSPEEEAIEESVEEAVTAREVHVTASFRPTDDGSNAIAFLPNAEAASLGLVVSAPREGGVDLFNADGEITRRHPGIRLSALATAPGFQLRGQSLPLVFGASSDGASVQGYAIVMDRSEVLDLPLADITPIDGVSGLCLLREGNGFVDLVILSSGPSAEIWRVRDIGEATLGVEQITSFSLPAPGRQCVADDGDIIVASPAGGLTRLTSDGVILNELLVAVSDLAVGHFDGAHLVLVTDGTSGVISSFDAVSFESYSQITVIDGLSTPGVRRPSAMAMTDQTYGFTAYSQGILAVFDAEDQRIKVISREAFTRAMTAEITTN
jgi:hypothetical protein